uniref:Uncharacterized protein n=1 Tax=Sphaerodactylus townsendi TaxID=933632 RepID=A0ACB8EQQ3_9SAUR
MIWRELLLDEHHTGDSPEEISQLFVRAILDHDSEKKVIQESRDTINKRPEYLDLTLLHTGASNGLSSSEISENISEQTEKGSTCLSDSSREEISHAQTIKYDQEFQEQREAKVWGDCEVEGHKCSTSIKNSHIMCKRDYSFSTTVDLHESLDSYFWPPLNDSSDEEWTDVVKAKRETLTKTHITSQNSASFLKSNHMIHTSISVLEDGLPSTRRATSFEKITLAAENLAEIGEKNKFKDFIWTLKFDNSSGFIDGAENTTKQVRSRNILFDPESQKDGLNCLSFHSQKKSRVQKKGTKSVHMAGMDKRFEENKCIGNEQTDNPFKGENNTGDETELELSLKKNPSILIHSLSTSFVLKSQGNTAWEVSPDSFDRHYKNHGCVEGDNVIQNSAPINVQDDINEYVSKGIIESPIGPKNSSVEFHIPRVKVDSIKKLSGHDKVLSNTHDNDNVLAQYYFYLNYLSQSKKPQLEEDNHSFSCEKLHYFSQEETLPIHCLSKNSNSMKDADPELVDHDFGPCGKNCHTDKRAEVIKPPEEQESKPVFTNSSPRSMPHLALTDKGKLGTLHSSKDGIQILRQGNKDVQKIDLKLLTSITRHFAGFILFSS